MSYDYEAMKKAKNWHHDIKKIGKDWIETVVQRYQRSKDPGLLDSIIKNYAIFRPGWARAFAPFFGDDVEEGSAVHDKVVWSSAEKFKRNKTKKGDGLAFNAYLVSGLLNTLKNLYNQKTSHKNHPRKKCPICGDQVYKIDEKHLAHRMTTNKYRKLHPKAPLSSPDGRTVCPVSGEKVEEITEWRLNRLNGSYSLDDFRAEFPDLSPKEAKCPMTGMTVTMTPEYPASLGDGYEERQFIRDFPSCEAIMSCPFTGKKMLGMTQERLDAALGQSSTDKRVSMRSFVLSNKNVTLRARRLKVRNPYTKKMVDQLTPQMLAEAGTNVKDHLARYAKIWIDKFYPDTVCCPFTGRRVKQIRHSDLEKLGRTPIDFYNAVSEYPLFRYQVKCVECGKWVDNIWEHLEAVPHFYAESLTLQEYEASFGQNATQAYVSNNSYVENESGDSIHVADLFAKVTKKPVDMMEVEDSLSKVAKDEMDKRLVSSVRSASTLEDVFFAAAEKRIMPLKFKFALGMTKEVRAAVKTALGFADFDIAKPPNIGTKEVVVMVPSRSTLRARMMRLIEESDIMEG